MTQPTLHSRGEFWVIGQFVLMAVIVVVGLLTQGHYTTGVLNVVVGILLCAVSLGFGWRGFVNLGKNLTAFPKPLADGQLVTSGVYAIVRHPIYTSVLAGCFGYALLRASWLAILVSVVLCVWFEFKSRREEHFLNERFPEYAAYAQSVKKFIPAIY